MWGAPGLGEGGALGSRKFPRGRPAPDLRGNRVPVGFSGGSRHPRSVDELVPSSRSGPRRQSMPPTPVTYTMWFDDEKVSFTGNSYEEILEQQKAWMIAQKIREEKAQYEEEEEKEEADGNDEDKHHQPESGDSYLDSMD